MTRPPPRPSSPAPPALQCLDEQVMARLSAADALALVRRDHPAFAGQTARWLENGWDNRVLEVDGELIFRFARRPDYPFELELAVLRALAGRSAVRIPEPIYVSRAPPYTGYRRIPGQHWQLEAYLASPPAARDELARSMAAFLATVHGELRAESLVPLGLGRDTCRATLERDLPLLERAPLSGLAEFARQAFRALEAFEARARDFVVLFADLHDENMLVDERGALSGVVDFGDVCWGEPHWEFRYWLWFSEDLLERSLSAYSERSGRRLSLGTARLLGVAEGLRNLARGYRDPASRVDMPAMQRRFQGWIQRGSALWLGEDA